MIGCRIVRTKGDHCIYKKEGLKRPIIVPMINDIPVFIIQNNLKTLGITREEYFKLLDKI
jgi:predicted RNA binding protein YcfA (HicA-like mRNA interferase family)